MSDHCVSTKLLASVAMVCASAEFPLPQPVIALATGASARQTLRAVNVLVAQGLLLRRVRTSEGRRGTEYEARGGREIAA